MEQPSESPVPLDVPTSHRRRRRVARFAAGASALVLVTTGAVTVGAAYADRSHPSTTSSSTAEAPTDDRGPGRGWGGPQQSYGDPWSQQGGQQGGQQSGGYGQAQQTTQQTEAASDTQVVGLVRIQTVVDYGEGEAAGTGMVLTSNGEVVTNHHVVDDATKITATVMSTGKTYTATVVGTDADDDVAVLRLTGASGLSTITPDDDPVAVGDTMTAVGDANGDETLSQASGDVTTLDKAITTQDETGGSESLQGLIEYAANVIAGDSGGATYDDEGEVSGMTTAASTGGGTTLGYAIPIATVLRIADDLTAGVTNADYAYGYPAFLGIGLGDDGTTVGQVYDGSAADQAGITAGDTITRVGSKAVSTADGLKAAIATYSPGDSVRIAWTDSDGTTHIGSVTLKSGPVA